MVTKENQGCDEVIEWIDTQDDSIAIRCGDSRGKFCPECKAKNQSQSSGEIVSSQEMSNDIQEKITESPTLNGSLEKSPVYNLQQELQQVEEGCGYSIYIGLENEKCDMQCRKGDLCPACKLKQTYLQQTISALEQKDKEIIGKDTNETMNKIISKVQKQYPENSRQALEFCFNLTALSQRDFNIELFEKKLSEKDKEIEEKVKKIRMAHCVCIDNKELGINAKCRLCQDLDKLFGDKK